VKTNTKNNLTLAAVIALASGYGWLTYQQNNDAPSSVAAEEVAPMVRGWVDTRTTDQITGEEVRTRCTSAPLPTPLEFPQHRATEAAVCFRFAGRDVTAHIGLDHRYAQIVCGRECELRISIDSRPASLAVTGDIVDSHYVRVANARELYRQLTTAESFRVEIPFYRSSARVLDFDVDNL